MKLILRQKIWLTIVVVANLLLWIIPSDVVEQIARGRQTMLGRYSRTHFYWILGAAVISIISFYIDWSTGKTYKRRWFQFIATTLLLAPTLAVVDFLLRTPQGQHYIRDSIAYHRPVDSTFTDVFEDRPPTYRTYPNAAAGFGRIECELTTDSRGYRNRSRLDRYDIVVLGDSFTEGSSVTDDDPWPVRLSKHSGLSVYNLGMSGYDPLHYLQSLKELGLSLKPKVVVCMIYEGNDFRSAKTDRKRKNPSVSKRFKGYVKRSPLLNGLDRLLIETFAPIGSAAELPDTTAIDWLPLAIPAGASANFYTFAPKQLRDLYESREEFSRDKHWLNPRRQIAEMNELCKGVGCKFVLAYAPTKAHVVLPVVADELRPESVRAFMALRYKKELPEADVLLKYLVERADAREDVLSQWCKREGIALISTTAPLREAAIDGMQVYFTYDQHWTPDGHDVVARTVLDHLSDVPRW